MNFSPNSGFQSQAPYDIMKSYVDSAHQKHANVNKERCYVPQAILLIYLIKVSHKSST